MSRNDPALDAFVDDCFLMEDTLCNYQEEDLDFVSSKIIEGIWEIEEQQEYDDELKAA